MVKLLDITEFLAASEAGPVLDVRAPVEFKRGHIPEAVNLPLFDDTERAEIGTLYKQKGARPALLAGLDIIGPKMSELVRSAERYTPNRQVRLHCWRGGQRSGSVAWLLEFAGFKVTLLRGGYKAYRQQVLASFTQPWQLRVLSGRTGSGKTELLQAMAKAGAQVVDLEGLAQHRGSAFGALGLPPQPVIEQFENLIYEQLRHFDPHEPVWLEDENKMIGRVTIPVELRRQMLQAPVVVLETPLEQRVSNLLELYGAYPAEQLAACLENLRKRLGHQDTQICLNALAAGDLSSVVRRSLQYYDKAYDNSLERRGAKPLRFQADPDAGLAHSAQALIELSSKEFPNV